MSNPDGSKGRKRVGRRSLTNKKGTAGRREAGPSSLPAPKSKERGEPKSDEAERRRRKEEEHENWKKNTERKMKKAPRSTVRKELPKVLVSLLDEAQKGSCQHAKLLFEFADASGLPDVKEQQKSQTLTELLLEKLEP
jgi:hypothetical protein